MVKDNEIGLTKTESVCKCQDYSTCAWSNQVVTQLVYFFHFPFAKFLTQQFQLQICDQQKHYVWCCRNGEQASDLELKILNKKQDNDKGCDSEVNSGLPTCWVKIYFHKVLGEK